MPSIVRMPGKMCVAQNQFFLLRHENDGRSYLEKFEHFVENIK